MKAVLLAIIALCSQPATSFSTNGISQSSKVSSLKASNDNNVILSGVAAAVIATAVVAPDTAMAYDSYYGNIHDFGASTELLAARSGGRAGGRSSAPRSMPRSTRSTGGASSTVRNYSSTTVVQPPTTIVRPASTTVIMGSPFGYSPFGGYGMGYGVLGAASSIGNEIRDVDQSRQIANERVELEKSKVREQQLEERLRVLEMQQFQQNGAAPVAPAAVAPVAK